MGILYVVATPIGNLEDISDRAKRVLAEVDFIAAEDTRHTSHLLSHLNIRTLLSTYHDHSETSSSELLIEEIKQGKSVALVSDAGTPLISDPGYRLVKRAREEGLDVVPVPGPSALIAALSVAGLPSDRFSFHGFIPAKNKARQDFLEALVDEPGTQIFYESPHRMVKCLQTFANVYGKERTIVLARELTKTFEQVVSAPIGEVIDQLDSGEIRVKGEFVILLQGQQQARSDLDERRLLIELLRELPASKAAEIAARLTGQPRKKLYKIALSLKQK